MLGLGPFGNTRDRPPFGALFAAPFGLCCRVSFLNREKTARIFAARAAALREFAGAVSGTRMSILAKRRTCRLLARALRSS
jgi:hypothetical protein